MQILDAAATATRLPYRTLVDALKEVLRAKASGTAYAPVRLAMPLPNGATVLLMPATDGQIACTKVVTVHPENGGKGLPTVQGEVVVFDAATGQRFCLLDGVTVTGRRTAAVSCVAAEALATDLAGPLLIVGAGSQAGAHLDAMVELFPIRHVYIASRTRNRAEQLAGSMASRGVKVDVVPEPASVIDQVSLIVTATTSSTPVLPARLRPGTLVMAVGAYTPAMAELPPELVRHARIVVDTLEGARAEAGDLIQAQVDWSSVVALENVLDNPASPADVIVFKSVGHALWDLAAARAAVGHLAG